jgi:hypothetical protein
MEGIMPVSSDSIAQLAAAMAKAQSELVNPIKSLTAVLERGRTGIGPISYRYAPLSAGLDILRKVLGKYELATIQTTHVDRDRGLVLLTTTIAHSSGEWISALWPVCHISDIGHPKLMGAALTYARRYCLFTMVGLAGEDDLDAPDLGNTKEPSTDQGASVDVGPEAGAGSQASTGPEFDRARPPGATSPLTQPISGPGSLAAAGQDATLGEETSLPRIKRKTERRSRRSGVSRRDPAGDLAQIEDPEALLQWALDSLPARNKLDDTRREALDAAFLAKAEAIGADPELLIPFADRGEPSLDDNSAPNPD